jgi:hypothetical protein
MQWPKPVIPAIRKVKTGGSIVQARQSIKLRTYSKNNESQKSWEPFSRDRVLPGKHKALSSIPSTAKKKKKTLNVIEFLSR